MPREDIPILEEKIKKSYPELICISPQTNMESYFLQVTIFYLLFLKIDSLFQIRAMLIVLLIWVKIQTLSS